MYKQVALDTLQQDEQKVWQQFLAEPTVEYRNILIQQYTELVNIIAAKFYQNRQIKEIEFDEFKQLGLIGLIESIDRFDPSQGAGFQTYASHRIKGAILNGIEKYCEKQQQISIRSRLRTERMQNLLEEVTLQQQDIFARLVDMAVGTAIGIMLENTGMFQSGDSQVSVSPYVSRELHDLSKVMERLVLALPDQERMVIRMHYYQQLKFELIADELKLTKGRISQIHHSALKRMHEYYDELKVLRTEY
ncbi:RNA polymerase, sigma 28 subunit, SigD/FliA/WhiG [Methylophilaceae bacterium 11]|nr:RNA polymerase, sigma 28 subunit, SigD/FliA/WhiG [Methylophilaceae bacterium 11]